MTMGWLTRLRAWAGLAQRGGRAPRDGLPSTFRAVQAGDDARPKVFDPALEQFAKAFRQGDPVFADDAAAGRWRTLRLQAMDCVLGEMLRLPWAERMVLRGSRVMKFWMGERAREPKDLDFVVEGAESAGGAEKMVEALVAAVRQMRWPAGVSLVPEKIATDEIWIYSRAPGRRVVFPWRAEGLPGGVVQVDVVTGETMVTAPVREEVMLSTGEKVAVWTASREQSLAWKLMWLLTDNHPQGKDLFDAVLLAEAGPFKMALLRRCLLMLKDPEVQGWTRAVPEERWEERWRVAAAGKYWMACTGSELMALPMNWVNFEEEYPQVRGMEAAYKGRLVRALGLGDSTLV